jgi:hypothetical protein
MAGGQSRDVKAGLDPRGNPPMLRIYLLSSFLLLAPALPAVEGADGPRPSFPIEADAEAFVAKRTREELSKDEVFVAMLQELARSDLSPRSKADAFALMQERIGWLFVGTARLFPGCGYFQTQTMVLSTYFQYQQKMPHGLDVAPLLAFAKETRADHPLRASNTLLLATVLNPAAAHDAVKAAIDAKLIASAKVPAIDLHNLSLAAALTADPKVVARLLELLPETDSEESREDLLVASGIYRNDELRDAVEGFLRKRFPASFDNSVQTGLMVLAHAGPVEHFREFYKSLGKDQDSIEKLSKLWDSGFRDRLQSDDPKMRPLKIWDGFTVRLENDGAWVTFGDAYRYWLSFK